MTKMTPEAEARYALDFGGNRSDLSIAAQIAYDQLTAAIAKHGALPRPECEARFPSSPETRRAILDAIAGKNPKYARPFDGRNVASVSFAGTESWSDYGAVVLQMAMLDTLLSIEEKLGRLLPQEKEQ